MSQRTCHSCNGNRLKPDALAVTVLGMNIMDVTRQSVENALDWVEACRNGTWPDKKRAVSEPLTQREASIADQILKEIEIAPRILVSCRTGLSDARWLSGNIVRW